LDSAFDASPASSEAAVNVPSPPSKPSMNVVGPRPPAPLRSRSRTSSWGWIVVSNSAEEIVTRKCTEKSSVTATRLTFATRNWSGAGVAAVPPAGMVPSATCGMETQSIFGSSVSRRTTTSLRGNSILLARFRDRFTVSFVSAHASRSPLSVRRTRRWRPDRPGMSGRGLDRPRQGRRRAVAAGRSGSVVAVLVAGANHGRRVPAANREDVAGAVVVGGHGNGTPEPRGRAQPVQGHALPGVVVGADDHHDVGEGVVVAVEIVVTSMSRLPIAVVDGGTGIVDRDGRAVGAVVGDRARDRDGGADPRRRTRRHVRVEPDLPPLDHHVVDGGAEPGGGRRASSFGVEDAQGPPERVPRVAVDVLEQLVAEVRPALGDAHVAEGAIGGDELVHWAVAVVVHVVVGRPRQTEGP
jgi:hypothetical protein